MSDFLTDEEQVARLKSWWDENGKALVAGLVIVVVGVVGYRWYDGYRADQVAAASVLYERFLTADADARLEVLAELDEQGGSTSYATLAHFHVARGHVEQADYEAAAGSLRQAVAAAPEALLADLGRLRLARVLHQLDQTEAALEALASIRSSGFRSLVAELRGDIHLARGELEAAGGAYAAAAEAAGEQVARPVLEIKLADTQGRVAIEIEPADADVAADAADAAAAEAVPEAADAEEPTAADASAAAAADA